jgi:hypothetical protein
MNTPSRIVLAALLSAAALPALAADPAQDCTVCRDPMWPAIAQPMPGIPLDQPAQPAGPTGIQINDTRLTVASRANGVGAGSADVGRGSVYADPLWPQVRSVPAGMAAAAPSAPATSPAAKPALPGASAPVASR